MSVMTATRATRSWPPDDRPLTVEDLDALPDDGTKYELDDGVLVMSPAPAISHQLVLQRLSETLGRVCPADFLVLPGPGIEMSKIQYRIPDMVVVRIDAVGIADKNVTKPPVLAIEIASPSTALYDRNRKKDVYAGFGIASYWIVTPSPDKPSLTVFELRDRSYVERALVAGNEVYRAERPFAVEICPASLVALRRPG